MVLSHSKKPGLVRNYSTQAIRSLSFSSEPYRFPHVCGVAAR